MFRKTNLLKSLLFVTTVIAIALVTAQPACALSQSYYSPTSRLASGKWVKIKVTQNGIHEISYDQLSRWGFSDPTKVHVYGYGGTVLAEERFIYSSGALPPDDLNPTYTLHENNKIFFYGTADVDARISSIKQVSVNRNYYSTAGYYFLSDRDMADADLPAEAPFVDERPIINAHLAVDYHEHEIQHPTVGGAIFLGHNVPANGSVELPFEVTNMGSGNTDWKTASMRVTFGALNSSRTTLPVDIPAEIDPESVDYSDFSTVASSSVPYTRYLSGGYTTRTFPAVLDNGSYVFSARHPGGNIPFLAVDAAWLIYPRLNVLAGDTPALEMTFLSVPRSENFELTAPATTRIVNISLNGYVFPHQTRYDPETGIMTASFDRAYDTSYYPACRVIAFDPAKEQLHVEFAGEIQNQNLHGTSTPDMLVITTESLLPYAEQLAEAHRRVDGLDVIVITQDKAFNEFSSGTPDAMGYRRLVKMFYDRDPKKMKYVLLYGPAIWDNRAITVEPADRLLTYETTNSRWSSVDTYCFASDAFFGMIDDQLWSTASKMTVAVGRIPARDASSAAAVNRKLIRYINSHPAARSLASAVLVSDDGDNNIHLRQTEWTIDSLSLNRPAITAVRAHNAIYEWENSDAKILRSVVSTALRRGAGYLCLTGHNDDDYFGAERLFTRSDAQSMSNDVLPVAMLSTCDAFGFDLNKNCITEDLFYNEKGGAIGVIAAARVVYGSYNQDLSGSVAGAYGRLKPGSRLGDLWREGRNTALALSSQSGQVNTLCYNLCGDPAVALPAFDYDVVLSSVNGNPVDNENTISLDALKPVRLAGRIVNADGETVDDFNGSVNIILHDAPYDVKTMPRNHAQTDPVLTVTLDETELVSKSVDVSDGLFETTLVAPVPVREGGINRLTFTADSRDGLYAGGLFAGLSVKAPDTDDDIAAGDPPVILSLAVNAENTPDGAVVTAPVNVLAKGTVGQQGFNTSGNLGAASSLLIDGNIRVDDVTRLISLDNHGNWSLSAPVDDLDEGAHTARLTINDNLGNSTTAAVSFFLSSKPATIPLQADRTTTDAAVILSADHSLGDNAAFTLVVENMYGHPVATYSDINFPYELDFRNIDGDLPDGYYDIHVQGRTESARGASTIVRVAYIKSPSLNK